MPLTLMCDSLRAAGSIVGSAGIGLAMASSRVLVTSVCTSAGRLKLITWRIGADGRTLDRLSDSGSQAGEVSLVDIFLATADRFITAVRADNGQLLLIAWHVNSGTGAVTRRADSGGVEGDASLLAMARSPRGDGSVVIAIRDASKRLVLKHWALLPNEVFKRLGDTALQGQAAGAISFVALGTAGPNRVVAAVRGGSGKLKLIVWDVLAAGGIKRLGDSGQLGDPIDRVDLCTINDFVVTVTCGGGAMKVTSWRIAPDGSSVAKVSDSGAQAGPTDRVACIEMVKSATFEQPVLNRVVTAVRARHGGMKLIVWKIASNGAVTRDIDFDERTGPIEALRLLPNGSESFVSAVQRSDGRLALQTWRFDAAQPQLMPDGILAHNASMFENSVQVVPPQPALPRGRIVVNLGSLIGQAGLSRRDLLDGANAVAGVAANYTVAPYPLDPLTQCTCTDNQIIRLAGQRLLAIKNGCIWSELDAPPEWFGSTVGGFCNSAAGLRNAVYVMTSHDAGLTWSRLAVIDSAVEASGKYGWPQPATPNPGLWNGGFDRPELYRDPWTGWIYITAHGDGGPYKRKGQSTVSNAAGVVFRSTDQGTTWGLLHSFDQAKGSGPYVMTSTPAHPLILLQLLNGAPTLHVLAQGAAALTTGLVATEVEGGTAITADARGAGDSIWSRPASMARIDSGGSSSRVRIAYPTLNATGGHDYRVCIVTLGAGQGPQVDSQLTITPVDPVNTTCALGAFVEHDLVDSDVPERHCLFYWLEVPLPSAPPGGRIVARYKLFSGPTGHGKSDWLSLNQGQRHDFANVAVGHYMKGANFLWNKHSHFLALWREPDGVRGNIVSVAAAP